MLGDIALAFLYYAAPLVLTVLLEAGTAYLCGLNKKEQHALLLCNLLTNPFLNLLLLVKYTLTGAAFPLPVVLLFEALVVLAEGLLLQKLCGKGRKWFALSLLFNAVSYGIGLLLTALLF